MAQVVTRELVDDIDGSAAERTFTFAVEDIAYEIDLSSENITEFRSAIGGFVESARRAGKVARVARGIGNGRASADREQTAAIRRWLRKNGHEVSDRGRISAVGLQAFDEAHKAGAVG